MVTSVASYPFLNILWSIIIVVPFVIWIWMMIMALIDIFSHRLLKAGEHPSQEGRLKRSEVAPDECRCWPPWSRLHATLRASRLGGTLAG